jgi:hypothetical protein
MNRSVLQATERVLVSGFVQIAADIRHQSLRADYPLWQTCTLHLCISRRWTN